MKKWTRANYQPNLPLNGDKKVTASLEHIELSRQAAAEGMVLLKNENDILPLAKNAKIALFGKGTFDYVKGGGGSGDVYTKYVHNIYDGFKSLGVEIFEPLCDYYKKDIDDQYHAGSAPGMTVEPKLPEELAKAADYLKNDDKGVSEMCEVMEKLINVDRRNAILELLNAGVSREVIMKSYKISKEELEELIAPLASD